MMSRKLTLANETSQTADIGRNISFARRDVRTALTDLTDLEAQSQSTLGSGVYGTCLDHPSRSSIDRDGQDVSDSEVVEKSRV